jgi:3-oxoacyl-[acyl-carrier protein] reductase
MNLGLAGRTVLVTGASSGIGAALASGYGRENANVAITYHSDPGGAAQTAKEVIEAGGQAITLPFDLGDLDSVQPLVTAIEDRWGGIDVLAANAVRWPDRSPSGRFEDLKTATWQNVLRDNIEGNLALVQAVLPAMRTGQWGRILFMSTGMAEEGMFGCEAYTTAKAALHGFARSLAWGVGGDGILVNVMAAGLTLTERNLEAIPKSVADSIASRVPLRALSKPSDLVPIALFLTSEANNSITGEVVREGSSNGRSSHTV